MLDFEFSPTQTEYRKQLREFALQKLLPGYQQREEEGRYPAEEIRQIIRFTDAFWKGREDERDLLSVGITAEASDKDALLLVGLASNVQLKVRASPSTSEEPLPSKVTVSVTKGVWPGPASATGGEFNVSICTVSGRLS